MEFKQAHALLVGVGEYQDSSVPAVPITIQDAQALKAVLVDPSLAGYPAEQVSLLTGTSATRLNILAALEKLAEDTNSESTVLILLCAHGVPAPNGGYYLLSHEARRKGLDFEADSVVTSQELLEALGKIKPKKMLIILNTCYSGIMAGSLDPSIQPPSNELLGKILADGEGRVIISACRFNQSLILRQARQTPYLLRV